MIYQELLQAAITVRNNAQAPYSKFNVGASVLSTNGNIYRGCNVERCTYTQTTHAEQNAIDSMIAGEGPTNIAALAVVASGAQNDFNDLDLKAMTLIEEPPKFSCCGHCLQIIWENCDNVPTVPIFVLLDKNTIYKTTIETLFPYRFGPYDLRKATQPLTKQ